MPPAAEPRWSPELERAILAGVVWGAIPVEQVSERACASTLGRRTLAVIHALRAEGATFPLSWEAVALGLTHLFGVEGPAAREWVTSLQAALPAASGAAAVHRRLRERYWLMRLANLAAGQLERGEFAPAPLWQVLSEAVAADTPLAPMAEIWSRGSLAAPPRLPVRALPRWTERVGGGLVGITVFAGEPGVGKSTLAWMIALDAGEAVPVLYYDFDNDLPTLVERTVGMIGEDLQDLQAATRRIYLRESIQTLEADLQQCPPPALVVVDLVQDLPAPVEYERQGLNLWLHRWKAVRRRGYWVLLISEVSRAYYGRAGLAAAKGTGEIEFAASLACQMLPVGEDGTEAELVVTKNRHGPARGAGCRLRREGLLWREVD